ncbi:MAG TPA: phosphatase PAP2 family protein [Rhodobacteraceae bacterium]|nr:phosphatase PAP2 family protein [Paracoccaceae bacterium]
MSSKQIITFALIGLGLSVLSILTLDYWLAPKVVASESSHKFWNYITNLGSSGWMAVFIILWWLAAFALGKAQPTAPKWPNLRKKAALVFAAVAVPGLFILIVKFFVGRARPYTGEIGFFPFTQGSAYASWPSGHTTTAFGFAVAIGLAFPALRWPLIAIAALIGYSRMVLEMHYLGDVIMGATIGTLGAVLVYNWLRPKIGLKA